MAQAERAPVLGPADGGRWGLDPKAAAAFRAVARERGPGLAAAYGRLWRKATGRIGKAPWGAPWPETWTKSFTWREAGRQARLSLGDLDARLAGRAQALWLRRRVRRQEGAPAGCAGLTRLQPLGPLAVVAFDGSPSSAVNLAHELGHAAFLARGWFSAGDPPQCRAGAEAGAFLAEHAFRTRLCAHNPRAGASRWAEDHLALLVRHAARDALETALVQGAPLGEAWPALAGVYAPALAWAPIPPVVSGDSLAAPGLPVLYAVAYAVTLAAWRNEAARARLPTWVDLGPHATLEALALLADLPLHSGRSYQLAFDLAEADLAAFARLE